MTEYQDVLVVDVCENMIDVVEQKISEMIETNRELINDTSDLGEKERLRVEIVGLERAREEIVENRAALIGRCNRWSNPY